MNQCIRVIGEDMKAWKVNKNNIFIYFPCPHILIILWLRIENGEEKEYVWLTPPARDGGEDKEEK